jgi:hypothetical protein
MTELTARISIEGRELTSIHLTLFLGSPFTLGSADFHGTFSSKRVYRCLG